MIAASIAGVAAITSAVIGKRNQTHLQEIKVNVDGNLSRALTEIDVLKTQSGDLKVQVAELITALGKSTPAPEGGKE